MAITNHERVGKSLDLLRQGLAPFVEREMEANLGANWLTRAAQSMRRDVDLKVAEGDVHLDVHALLIIMWDNWNEVFRQTLGHAERSLVSEIREIRNQWAHQQAFSTDDAYRALDSIARLLTSISAPEARDVEAQKQELLRIRFEEQARYERRKAAVTPLEGQPTGGLRPWRELVTPHPDVASGRYQQAEFAADLAAVHHDEAIASSEYRDPQEFYQRTYLTQGLRYLLRTALLRLSDDGGDPVVELQTNFGGGKTHSMLALYHLFSDYPASQLQGIDVVLDELDLPKVPEARRAVLVGTALSPGQPHQKPDGTVIRTFWGEMAWQLGDAAGDATAAYALVADSDRDGVSPGSYVLRDLMARYSPCLILIDEWVAYVRQTYKVDGLPAGSFDANMTFAQALTEAVKQVPTAILVASLPASDIEIGGEGGREALTRLRNTFGRVESAWRPASAEEGFEIIRRRLFQPIVEQQHFVARDNVIKTFSRLYQDQSQEFPSACREGDYARRMMAAYPIHPELFDRLYEDWSALEKFQRTRGVLRLMAAAIHALWERNDGGLLILPASVPIDSPAVQSELTRYLEDNWLPVIEKDVDGSTSLPLTLDRENPNLGRYSAVRRVARTIYMGSAPTARTKNPGIDERNIKLGCVQPGESVATFEDALRRLTDKSTHLYVDRSRFWFSTQPSVTRLAQDRSAQINEADVWEELKQRLRADRKRGDLSAVHAVPETSGDIPDEDTVRMVILGPDYPHSSRDAESPALTESHAVLSQRGKAPRLYQNMLVFLAPDRNRLNDLDEAIRQYLAWKSIHNEREILNLDTFQRNQAQTKFEQADETVAARIQETYIWLLVPYQSDPRDPKTLVMDPYRLQGSDPLAERACRKMRNDELLITTFSGIRLRMALDNHNLWQDKEHVGVKQLWEYLARYPYLPRLKNRDVLLEAIKEGVNKITWKDNFAYAQGYDEGNDRYLNLAAGSLISVTFDSQAVVVKEEAATRQIEQEDEERRKEQEKVISGADGDAVGAKVGADGEDIGVEVVGPEKKLRRFYGIVDIDPVMAGSGAGKVADAVIQYLAGQPNAKVTVTLEIEAELPDGAPDHVVRTVTENAHTLKFKDYGFEE